LLQENQPLVFFVLLWAYTLLIPVINNTTTLRFPRKVAVNIILFLTKFGFGQVVSNLVSLKPAHWE
jgi:hypothetical protein